MDISIEVERDSMRDDANPVMPRKLSNVMYSAKYSCKDFRTISLPKRTPRIRNYLWRKKQKKGSETNALLFFLISVFIFRFSFSAFIT